MYKQNLIKLVALLILSLIATSCSKGNEATFKWRYADALPAVKPLNCVSPNAKEKVLLDISATAIELGDSFSPNSLDVGAQQFLGNGIHGVSKDIHLPICMPNEIYERASLAIENRGGFGNTRMVEYQLALAAKLIHPGEKTIADVARTAFANTPQQSENFLNEDIRPYARTVLAGFGHSSKPYANLAFQQIEADTPLGTGAAQVAAAAGHPEALPKIISLFDGIINNLDKDKPIPLGKRKRLYELAWAIAYSGEAGKAYVNRVDKLMGRLVETIIPSFGVYETYPKQMCRVLNYMEGQESLSRHAYCTDEKIPYEH